MLYIGAPVYKKEHPAHRKTAHDTVRHFRGRAAYHRYPGDSCLVRARATIFADYLKRTSPWTHYLQTDDDQSWGAEHLEQMLELSQRYPVLGLPCAYKFDPPHRYAGCSTIRGMAGEKVAPDGTVRVHYLGGGMILWRDDVLRALMEAYPERAFDTNNPDQPSSEGYCFWAPGVVGRELLSEDYMACHLAAELGFEIRAWLGACSPHWVNPPADETDPSTWKAYLPRGYAMAPMARAA